MLFVDSLAFLTIGDFNIGVLTDSSSCKRLKDLLGIFNLVWLIDYPTTVLDNAFTNISNCCCLSVEIGKPDK